MSSKGLGKSLTTELVFTKTKSDSLHNIKNLNLWGNDLQDLSLIQKMPNLQVVSLSVNRISSLKYFASCQKLQELYLRKNNITDLRQIKSLVKLPALKVLWLHDNPCAQVENYREIVIKYLPNLVKLDNNQITPEEKASSQKVNFNLGSIQDNYKSEASNMQSHGSEHRSYVQLDQYKQRPMTSQSGQSHQINSSQKHNRSQIQDQQQRQMPPPNNEQRANKKNMQRRSNPDYAQEYIIAEQNMNRNQNILMAILSLMRELDPGSLEIIKRQAQKMIQ